MHSGKRLGSYERVERQLLVVGRWLFLKLSCRLFCLQRRPRRGTSGDFFVTRRLFSLIVAAQTMTQSAFSDLRVWQSAMELALQIYRETSNFPRSETYGLTQQMRRAAVSVPSNIAEGKGRRTSKDFSQFLFQARGSLLELQTLTMIAKRLCYLGDEQANVLLKAAAEVGKSLAGLINSLAASAA